MAISLKSLFKPDRAAIGVHRLYDGIVEQARSPAFYGVLGVPDTPAGRFSMIALHCFLVMDRLGQFEGEGELSQALFDTMFADMDRNLREMGVGDLSVGKKIKNLAQKFYAMAVACRQGLNAGDDVLRDALSQSVYGGELEDSESLAAMTGYVRACVSVLEEQEPASLARGHVRFAAAYGGTG